MGEILIYGEINTMYLIMLLYVKQVCKCVIFKPSLRYCVTINDNNIFFLLRLQQKEECQCFIILCYPRRYQEYLLALTVKSTFYFTIFTIQSFKIVLYVFMDLLRSILVKKSKS